MLKITQPGFWMVLIAIILLVISCDKKETERTWEQEMDELNTMLRELEAQGIDIDTTRLSVYYFVRKSGEGPNVKVGDSCSVSYISFFQNGRVFEDSKDIFPSHWNFVYKPSPAIVGLVDGISYMNKGSEFQFYISSDRAYGAKGTAIIPPFTTLVYRVILHDLKPANN
jgi:FKBP-type peptidyl-prolyl cis-trans isomerase FkpA